MPKPVFDIVGDPDAEISMTRGTFGKIVQIAAEKSYSEGLQDATEMLRRIYQETATNTSYSRGQRRVLRRVADELGIDLEK